MEKEKWRSLAIAIRDQLKSEGIEVFNLDFISGRLAVMVEEFYKNNKKTWKKK